MSDLERQKVMKEKMALFLKELTLAGFNVRWNQRVIPPHDYVLGLFGDGLGMNVYPLSGGYTITWGANGRSGGSRHAGDEDELMDVISELVRDET